MAEFLDQTGTGSKADTTGTTFEVGPSSQPGVVSGHGIEHEVKPSGGNPGATGHGTESLKR